MICISREKERKANWEQTLAHCHFSIFHSTQSYSRDPSRPTAAEVKPQHEAFRQRTMKKTVIIDTALNTARLFTVHICNSQISQKYQLKISQYFTCISSSRNLNLELFSSATCPSHLLWAGAHRSRSKLQVAIQQSFIASGSYAETWKKLCFIFWQVSFQPHQSPELVHHTVFQLPTATVQTQWGQAAHGKWRW